MSDAHRSRGALPRLAASLLLGVVALTGAALAAEDDRVAALEAQVEALRAEIEAMKAVQEETESPAAGASAEAAAPSRLDEVERKLDVLSRELETLRLGEVAVEAGASEHGFGPAASKIYRAEQGLSVGGYGEMVYQRFDGDKKDELDFLRGIVYFGYKFDDRWLFNSEIEFEHASTGEEGEASVEFAYLDYLHRDALGFRAGLLLVPMGFINELHEPTVFLGANRPATERTILPSTWRENGFGIFGDAGPATYRSYVINGLEGEGFSASGLRGGRQKGSKAVAEDFAWVTRVDVTPTPGLVLGGSLYLGDSGQGIRGPAGETLSVGTTIVEAHAEWSWQGLHLRGLAARAELDDVAALNATLGLAGKASIGDELQGYYLEAGYDVLTRVDAGRKQLTPFVRWEQLNTQESVPTGFAADPARDVDILTVGLDFKPIDQVVLKLDYQDVSNATGGGTDQLNLGLGYIF
jgi:hypothetical protein